MRRIPQKRRRATLALVVLLAVPLWPDRVSAQVELMLPRATQLHSLMGEYPNISQTADWVQIRYFDLFPSSFPEFRYIFMYLYLDHPGFEIDKDDPRYGHGVFAELYRDSHEYVKAIFSLTAIPSRVLDEKLVDLCLGGRWDADGVSHLQHYTNEHFLDAPQRLIDVLLGREDEDVRSFFLFFFDGYEKPRWWAIPEPLRKWQHTDERLFRLMKSAFDEVMEQMPPHE